MSSYADAVFMLLDLAVGDDPQVDAWAARHGLVGAGLDDVVRAVIVDHGQALEMDGDRNLLLLGHLRRWRPGLSDRCRCEWLGVGTPEHEASPLCRSLRPGADRGNSPAECPCDPA